MGCLNANMGFNHWFGNIHLSGPCNRECYFCIGQHMMAMDALNTLDSYPLPGIDEFLTKCIEHGVKEINVTGTNTDPLLYAHTAKLKAYIQERIPQLVFGIRTNGALLPRMMNTFNLFDKGSITICSFDPDIYRKMMGRGAPPNLKMILSQTTVNPLKVNVVLGPENVDSMDIIDTIKHCSDLGIKKINIREPYGQPHIGDPLAKAGYMHHGHHLGMPYYYINGTRVTYWDVHYVEVESVNLYAAGNTSVLYPITKGHDYKTGKVLDQGHFDHGRHNEQWVSAKA